MGTHFLSSRLRSRPFVGLVTFALIANRLFYPLTTTAQDTTPKKPSSPQSQPPSKDDSGRQNSENIANGNTLKIKVNLVTVPVVVRDSSGHAVGTLHKEDFQVFDNRKPEEITQFTMERTEQPDTDSPAGLTPGRGRKFVVPNRFTAILFDDVHSTFQNLPQLQAASLRLVSNALARSERLGIFSTSGKLTVEFTDDRARLQDAIRRLKPNPLPGSFATSCPRLSDYDANQIINRHDLATREAAVSEVIAECGVNDPKMAVPMVMEAAERVLLIGDEQTALVLKALSGVLDRLSALRGQRTIVLASPSFLISDHEHREYELVDRAVKSHVIISTLDTRGVYTDENDIFDSNVLSEFADATGGIFFHNNNDLNEGLHRAVSVPESVYELGFSPKDLKEDGKFHHLKVKLVGNNNLVVGAREGYFAPTHLTDPNKLKTMKSRTYSFLRLKFMTCRFKCTRSSFRTISLWLGSASWP